MGLRPGERKRSGTESRLCSIALQISLLVAGFLLAGSSVSGQASPSDAAGNAAALLQSGNYQEARDAFEAQLQASPADKQAQEGEVEASERLAVEQRAAGNFVESLEALLRGEKYVPHSARLFYDQGILEDEMHLYPQALAALNTAQQLHMQNPKLLYAIARVYLDEGQLIPAAARMTAYLKQQPNDASAHYGLGLMCRWENSAATRTAFLMAFALEEP